MNSSKLNISIYPSNAVKRIFLWLIIIIIIGLNLNFYVPISTETADSCSIEKYGVPFIVSQYSYRSGSFQCPEYISTTNYLLVFVNLLIYFAFFYGLGEVIRKKMYKPVAILPNVSKENIKLLFQLNNFLKWELVQDILWRFIYILFSIPLVLPITKWVINYEVHGRSFDYEFLKGLTSLATLILIIVFPFLVFYFKIKGKELLFDKLKELKTYKVLWFTPIGVFVLYSATLYFQFQFKVIQWILLIIFILMIEFFIYKSNAAISLLQSKLGVSKEAINIQFFLSKYFFKIVITILILIAIIVIIVGVTFFY